MRSFRRFWLILPALLVIFLALGVNGATANQETKEPKTHGPDGLDLDKRGRKEGAAAPFAVDAHASWSASEYDGGSFTADQPDLTSHPTVHAVYVYPSNGQSRFSTFAAMFQADARQANQLLLGSYGAGVRFDERTHRTDATKTVLDISVMRSSSKSQKLSGASQFNLVRNELTQRGFNNPNKKYVVWLDAGSRYCGQGELYHHTARSASNYNELRTTGIVYRPYSTSDPSTGGFCRGRTLLHELGHNMGALQQVAPNAFDGAHCDDSAEDVMCYTSRTNFDSGGPVFDYSNDDYWDPAGAKLPWWAVNLSKYICPPAGCGAPSAPNY